MDLYPRAIRSLGRLLTLALVVSACGAGGHGRGSAPHASASATPGAGDATPASGGARLVVVGDSLAAGRFADSQAEAFPQRVAAALRARLEVLGVVGATTAQLAAQALPGGGDVVVVEAGTNDFLDQTPRRRFADDYRALLAKVAAGSPGAKLVCLSIWIPKDAPAKIRASFYNATIRRACAAGAVADVSPLFDAQPPTRGPAGRPTFLGPGDAFHPNSTGHAAIARLIESRLRSS
jgi:acyl-CoA thioesterase-1